MFDLVGGLHEDYHTCGISPLREPHIMRIAATIWPVMALATAPQLLHAEPTWVERMAKEDRPFEDQDTEVFEIADLLEILKREQVEED